jgi:hypothetical protein
VRCGQGRLVEAAALCEESATILRTIADPWTLSYPLRELATIAAAQGEYDRAEKYWCESLAVLWPLDETWFVCVGIMGLTAVEAARGDHLKAVRLAGAAESLKRAHSLPAAELADPVFAQTIAQLKSVLGEATFESEWAHGRGLSRNEAIVLALGLPNG